jgi:hypothetical protein
MTVNLFGYGKGLAFQTNLQVEECIGRIKSFADEERRFLWMATSSGHKEVVYKIDDNKFRLWRRRRHINNGLMPFFYGKFQENGGTIISGRFSMHPFIRIWNKILFGLGIVFAVLTYSILLFVGAQDGEGMPYYLYAMPIIYLLGLTAIVQLGIWLGQSDVKLLMDFLKNRLEARSIVQGGQSESELKSHIKNSTH